MAKVYHKHICEFAITKDVEYAYVSKFAHPKIMNAPLIVEPIIPVPGIYAQMLVLDFAEAIAKLELEELVLEFLKRHRIRTLAELLNTSIIHEVSEVWLALINLREALRKELSNAPGFDPDRYYFLIVTI